MTLCAASLCTPAPARPLAAIAIGITAVTLAFYIPKPECKIGETAIALPGGAPPLLSEPLADRLSRPLTIAEQMENDGGSLEEWLPLARSYGGLGRMAAAREKFAGLC
jgi:hypothetical protein